MVFSFNLYQSKSCKESWVFLFGFCCTAHHSIWVHLNGVLIRMTDSPVVWLLFPKSSDAHGKVFSVLVSSYVILLCFLFCSFSKGRVKAVYLSLGAPAAEVIAVHSSHGIWWTNCLKLIPQPAPALCCAEELQAVLRQQSRKRYLQLKVRDGPTWMQTVHGRGIFFSAHWDFLVLMTLIVARNER